MSILPRRQLGIYVTMGVAAVGAIAAGAVLYTSSKATDVELTSAELVPGDAGIYFALNTDLTSSQWVAAFDLAQRMGASEDPEQELQDSAEEEGDVDWEEDVAPFLGGNASVYLKGFDLETFGVQGALILKADDSERALEVVLDEAGDFEEDTYGGVDIFVDEFSSFFVTRIDEHIVFAIDQPSLEEVIDVHNGEIESLADNGDFRTLRDELTGNFLSFVYMDGDGIIDNFDVDDEAVRTALEDAGLSELVFEPVAGVFGAKGDAFEFQAAAVGDAGTISPITEPRESRFVSMVPADAAFFVSTAGIAQTWDQVVEAARDEIDEAIRSEGEYDSLDEAMRDAGSELGLESLEELIDLFTGETALVGWYTSDNEEDDVFVVLAEVNDEATAQDVVDTILEDEDDVRTEELAGIEVAIFTDDEGDDVAMVVHDSYLAIGDVAGVEAILSPQNPVLAQRDIYRDAVDLMPSRLGSYAYLNMGVLLGLAEGGVPAQLDEAERVMEAMILNLVDEDGVIRFSGVLTVADD